MPTAQAPPGGGGADENEDDPSERQQQTTPRAQVHTGVAQGGVTVSDEDSDDDGSDYVLPSSDDASDADDSGAETTASDDIDEVDRFPVELFDHLGLDALIAMKEAINSGIPAGISLDVYRRLDDLVDETTEYLDDSANWECLIAKGDGLWSLVRQVMGKPENEEASEELRNALHGKLSYEVRQRHGGGEEVICEYMIKVINSARGGLVFLVAAAARSAFFKMFAFLIPFFKDGGRMIIIVPVGEISTGTLHELRGCAEALEPIAKELGGGLRFCFNTDFRNDGLHVKELAIVKPPFTLITFFLTSNLNSAALGIEALFAKTPEQRQAAPQSGEVAGILIRDLRQDDAKGYLDRLSRYWVESGKRKELIWNVPALHEVFAVANETSADEERERLKRKLLKQAMSFFNPPIPAKLKSTASNIQFLIGAATDIAPPVCDSDLDSDSDSDDEDHDYDGDGGRPDEDGLGEDEKGEGSRGKDIDCDKEAMAEAEAERRRLNVKRKAATKRFREMHARPKMTTSERLKVTEDVVAELQEEYPELAELLDEQLEEEREKATRKRGRDKGKAKAKEKGKGSVKVRSSRRPKVPVRRTPAPRRRKDPTASTSREDPDADDTAQETDDSPEPGFHFPPNDDDDDDDDDDGGGAGGPSGGGGREDDARSTPSRAGDTHPPNRDDSARDSDRAQTSRREPSPELGLSMSATSDAPSSKKRKAAELSDGDYDFEESEMDDESDEQYVQSDTGEPVIRVKRERKKGRVWCGDVCDFCSAPRVEGLGMRLNERFDKTCCHRCVGRLRSEEGRSAPDFASAQAICVRGLPTETVRIAVHQARLSTIRRLAKECCICRIPANCNGKKRRLQFHTVDGDERTICRNCSIHAAKYTSARTWAELAAKVLPHRKSVRS